MNILSILYYLRNREAVYWDMDKRIRYEDYINKFMPKYYALFPSKRLKKKREKRQIVVSLTTIPSRIDKVWIPIECMLRQSCRPDKIVLWLGEDEFKNVTLPAELKRLQRKGLVIRFCKDVGVHTKYYYVLKEYAKDYVITIDDDVYYNTDVIKKLMRTARKNKGCVCARWVWQMEWSYHHKMYDSSTFESYVMKKVKKSPSNSLLALGVGAVLYPPEVFEKIDFQLDKALQLSQKADDIWLKAMEIKAGAKVAKVRERFVPDVIVSDTQMVALSHHNVGQNQNAVYLQNVFDYFNLWEKLK